MGYICNGIEKIWSSFLKIWEFNTLGQIVKNNRGENAEKAMKHSCVAGV